MINFFKGRKYETTQGSRDLREYNIQHFHAVKCHVSTHKSNKSLLQNKGILSIHLIEWFVLEQTLKI